ncbi:excinuclease ABC subunit UvrC [Alsobacter sp. SYSU M60028]|uniref:UvrABC system protein C n=1 Tax=Alsobacter ponti TaxID=2962936 RepID=A0ABT1L8K4_9HYPH|nr:excinuclease ABC subunit UvrC [Alsobacter ponti]MCP8937040.1 excinuclease ABC subunit UvrC [Alsobacter ponti]
MSRPPKTPDSAPPPPRRLAPADDTPPDGFDTDFDETDEADEGESEVAEADSGASLDFDEATGGARLKAGVAVIRHFWHTLPNGPGVYRMLDSAGDVLYVGKARSLKKRVASYARGIGHGNRIARMISETAAMEFVTTETETEALLLEANLIKQLKPRFNVLLRDDKSFPYIFITGDHVSPQLTKHRGARNRPGDYFGPFASVWAVNRTLSALQRAFLLRSCSDSYYENRTRPCLLHQIKRCAGPCTGEVGHVEYARLVAQARDFMRGKSQGVKQALAAEMQKASDDLEFERAARYRDRLAALSAIQSSQDINPRTVEEADVFALHEEAGQFCIEAFFFRNFQNWGNRAYFPKADRSTPAAEVLGAFVAQFYDDKPTPRLVLLSQDIDDRDLLQDALGARSGFKVEVAVPRRGEKRDLVEHACTNAREALGRKLADTSSQQKLLAALAQAFGVAGTIRRVEVYDNSHIMGSNAVGAMIVAGPQGFSKTHYRTFNIRSEELTPGDDFGMMREVLTRRFGRLVKEAPRDSAGGEATEMPAWPDLVLIDGGKGQLEAAREALAGVGVTDVPLVGVAKGPDRDAGRETFFVPGRDPFKLAPRDPALYFIQRLRDEAHRFAIGAHRAKRKREFTKSPLDEISGIGPARKRALLLHFGTAKAIARASLDDLATAPGVNMATARAVYDFFHDGRG